MGSTKQRRRQLRCCATRRFASSNTCIEYAEWSAIVSWAETGTGSQRETVKRVERESNETRAAKGD